VLHLGEDDLVARAELVQAPGVGDEVLGLGGVFREHHLLAPAAGTDELREFVVGLLVGDRGLLTQVVEAAVDVRVRVSVVVGDGVDHRIGRVRRRGVVEVDDLLPAELPLEDREVLPDGFHVERFGFSGFHYVIAGARNKTLLRSRIRPESTSGGPVLSQPLTADTRHRERFPLDGTPVHRCLDLRIRLSGFEPVERLRTGLERVVLRAADWGPCSPDRFSRSRPRSRSVRARPAKQEGGVLAEQPRQTVEQVEHDDGEQDADR